jgi:uncharacterized protein DUF5678
MIHGIHLDQRWGKWDYGHPDVQAQEIKPMEPIKLAEKLQGFEGNWVALKAGEVVAAARTPDRVVKELRSKQIEDATILRVPGEDEPELVGLG